ncbi:MAG: helix-turn-helix transcriptional regulator [Oscillospiraceae bacterium]|nr:helix-turn-helix transcriptional regulator [Oscillospiraceae bacterium]
MAEPLRDTEMIHEEAVQAARDTELPHETYQDLAALFRLFGDSTRLRILYALEQQEMCGGDLAALLGVTKSAVSHQLQSLRLSRLVKYRKDGQNVYYSLADDHVKKIVDMGLEHILE